MLINQYEQGRTYMGRLDYKSDMLEEINKICIKENIKTGYINIIGAVSSLKTGFFDQEKKEYIYTVHKSQTPLEISSCMGNVSLKNDKPFCHIHIVTSDRNGNCFGGHLMDETYVYAAEFVIQEVIGEELIRNIDDTTKLPLWK